MLVNGMVWNPPGLLLYRHSHTPTRTLTHTSTHTLTQTYAHSNPLQLHAGETLDSRIEGAMTGVYEEIKRTAKEFNTRGDLQVGR